LPEPGAHSGQALAFAFGCGFGCGLDFGFGFDTFFVAPLVAAEALPMDFATAAAARAVAAAPESSLFAMVFFGPASVAALRGG
jgi:hypothetical protein